MSAHRTRDQQGISSCVCFVCGSVGADYQLHSKSRYSGPYFPFLERHHCPDDAEKPGADGVVAACLVCYSFLTQQWETFEREKTPLGKRLYWLKRVDDGPYAGMDVKTQADYESNAFDFGSHHSDRRPESSRSRFGLDRPDSGESAGSGGRGRSDRGLSVDPVEGGGGDALDLSMPSRASSGSSAVAPSPLPPPADVCFLCSEESAGALLNVYARPVSNCPFFPNLAWHPKPSNAKSLDRSGRVQVCELCHRFLLQQWDCYQRQNVPHSDRTYVLNRNGGKQFTSTRMNSSSRDTTFVCFTCGMENPVSVQRVLSACPEADGDSYFSFLEQIKPPPGAIPLNSQSKALVCSLCYKSLSRQLKVYQMSGTPEVERKYKILNEAVDSEGMSVLRQHLKGNEKIRKQDSVACYVCEHLTSVDQLHPLDTLPQNGNMYFPFIRGLLRPSFARPMDHHGKVLVCLPCQMSLENQWKTFESAHIPSSQRQYTMPLVQSQRSDTKPVLSYPGGDVSRNPNSALCIQVTSPEVQIENIRPLSNHEPLLTTVSTLSLNSITTQQANFSTLSSGKPLDLETSHLMKHLIGHQSPRSKNMSHLPSKQHSMKTMLEDQHPIYIQTRPRISGPLDHSLGQPLLVAVNCFICGEYSPSGHTFRVQAAPDRSSSSSTDDHRISPFFPFLTKHTPSPGAECLAEDGSTLVCTFCFHSLIAQWLAYETSAQPEDDNCWQRKYNCHHYVCYICGIMTYRKRIRSITILDFPFLVEHPRPPGALTLDNGESVVTCLTCFESLTSQWKDFERMKVPVEMRKYNWIVLPPPPETVTDMNTSVSRNNSCIELELSHAPSINHCQEKTDNPDIKGLPHGSKPPPLTVHHPYGNSQKIPGRTMAAVSPLQVPSHANNVFSTFSGGSNPTLAATRTSSFAAALCKLAKQAVDPAIEKELSPITPTSSPTQSQQSVSTKRPVASSYFSTSQGTISLGSPPIVTMAPSQEHISHVVDSRKAIELTNLSQGNSNAGTNDRLVEPLSLKLEATKPAPLGLHFEKRNDHILTGKDFSVPSSLPGQLRPPPPLTSSHSDDSHSSSRGFQPYRSIDDTHHPLHSHVSPYDHTIAAYPYSSAFLPPRHLSHPTYRLEDSLYLERYNLPRAPMMHLHTPPGMLPHPSVPFYPNSRFPSDLLSHHMGLVSPSSMSFNHERQKQEEEHSREVIQEQEVERNREEEHERREYDNRWEREHHEMEVDVVSGGNDSGRTACSPLPMALSRNSESPMGRLGSITQGTPRDFVIRKSVTTVTSVVAPLNLAVHPPSGQRSNTTRVEKDMWPSRQVDTVADRVHLPQEQEGIGYRHPLLLQQIQHHPSTGRERLLMESSREADNLIKHSMHSSGRNNYDTKLHKTSISDNNLHSGNTLGVPNTELNGLPRSEHVHNSAFVQLTDSRESQKSIYSNHDHRTITDIRGNENGPNKSNPVPMSDLWAAPSHLRHEGIHARLLETERTRSDNQSHGLSRERLHRNHHIDDGLSSRPMYHYQTGNRQSLARNLPETVILPPIGKNPLDSAITTLDQPRVISKLDLEEEKIRKARLNGTYNSDESESDSEEENDLNRLNSMLIITKGPPLKLDTSAEKMKFLNMFGLITNRRKKAVNNTINNLLHVACKCWGLGYEAINSIYDCVFIPVICYSSAVRGEATSHSHNHRQLRTAQRHALIHLSCNCKSVLNAALPVIAGKPPILQQIYYTMGRGVGSMFQEEEVLLFWVSHLMPRTSSLTIALVISPILHLEAVLTWSTGPLT
ncbi:uncharacterized protein LOC111620060 [Centruroides sculpturatus]|uniref:uncharacterized protein LOC111620060 n=1 Tax=Centruroides sculpturatus TaxID=218467 RepID=UPI000C6DE800|nr:uncharacterized protein LOC111620060 [Centruroides sculpturatus]